MTGIGFLGAGVIMKDGLSVRGLTTAASIWTTAGIGILVGIGLYLPAALTTALALGALGGLPLDRAPHQDRGDRALRRALRRRRARRRNTSWSRW